MNRKNREITLIQPMYQPPSFSSVLHGEINGKLPENLFQAMTFKWSGVLCGHKETDPQDS